MNIEKDLQILELGFTYCKLDITLEDAKKRYLKLIEETLKEDSPKD